MGSNESPVRLRAIAPRWSTLRRRRGQPWVDWLKGAGFLVFHVDLFLVGIAALLLLNVARSPDHLWITGVFWRWGLLLVIHGMVTLLIWLIGMLLSEERPGAGTYEAEWSPTSHTHTGTSVAAEPIDALDGAMPWVAPPEDLNGSSTTAEDGWRTPEPPPAPADEWHAGFGQRTSWAETSASAWLARRRGERGADDLASEPTRDDA